MLICPQVCSLQFVQNAPQSQVRELYLIQRRSVISEIQYQHIHKTKCPEIQEQSDSIEIGVLYTQVNKIRQTEFKRSKFLLLTCIILPHTQVVKINRCKEVRASLFWRPRIQKGLAPRVSGEVTAYPRGSGEVTDLEINSDSEPAQHQSHVEMAVRVQDNFKLNFGYS